MGIWLIRDNLRDYQTFTICDSIHASQPRSIRVANPPPPRISIEIFFAELRPTLKLAIIAELGWMAIGIVDPSSTHGRPLPGIDPHRIDSIVHVESACQQLSTT
jgi:hypothetical protein